MLQWRLPKGTSIHIIGAIVGVALLLCVVYVVGFTLLGMPIWALGYLKRKGSK